MNQEFWTLGKKGYLYPLPKTSRCTLWGPDYPAQVRAGLSGLGKLRPRLGISGRKSAPSPSVALSFPLIHFWGPDYPALCEGRIIRPGVENPPQFRFSGRKSDRIPSDAPWLLLLENWGPDYPALAKPGLSGLGRKNRPSSDFPGENPTGHRATRLGFLER